MIVNKRNIVLFLAILIGIFLRFYSLSSVPPSASLDEASIGYNAYSILKTGADEYGNKFPILLRAYDDWRPALYVYLVIPFIKLWGLNVLAVRMPSAILSVLTLITTYFLVKELFKNNNYSFEIGNLKLDIPTIATTMLAISPWHIYLSRLGHEANAGFAFFVFGMYFFLKRRILLWIIFFTLSFISYQSEKIIIPLSVFGIFLIYNKELLRYKRKIAIAGILSLIILTPFIKETFSPNALIRFKSTSIFESQKERFEKQALLNAKAVSENNFAGKVIYNRRVLAFQIFIENYISHFNPVWLFTNQENDAHKVPGFGLLYIWEAPLVLLGIIFLVFGKIDVKIKKLIVLWILISPLPASITGDAPHAMRIYTMLPMPQVLAALGIIQVSVFLDEYKTITNKLYLNKLIPVGFMAILFITLYYFYNQYFIVFPKTQSASFQYALSQAIPFVLQSERQYNKIIISSKDNLYQSYMFFLFYSKYDPVLYQSQGGTKSGGFEETHKFGKFEFRPIAWKNVKRHNYLYVGNVYDFPKKTKIIAQFSNLNKEKVISVVIK